MSASITILPKIPRTLHINKVIENKVIILDIFLSELSIDERIEIAAWALQDVLIK